MYKEKNYNDILIFIIFVIVMLMAILTYFKFVYMNSNEKYIKVKDEEIITRIDNAIKSNRLYNISKLEKNIDNFNLLEEKEKNDIGFYGAFSDLTYLNVETIENYFKNTFNEMIYWNKKDIYCSCGEILYKYDNMHNRYILNKEHELHNEKVIKDYYTEVLEIRDTDDSYKAITINLWGYTENNKTIIYDSYNKALNNEEPLFEITTSSVEDVVNKFKEERDSYIKNMDTSIYVFKENYNNYLLQGFEYKSN